MLYVRRAYQYQVLGVLGVQHVRLLPGYPVVFPGRVLPVTKPESDPKPVWCFGLGTRVPLYPITNVSPWSELPDINFRHP